MDLHLTDLLSDAPMLSERELKAFQAADIMHVAALLMRMPRRYEDRRSAGSWDDIYAGRASCLKVRVYGTAWRFSYKQYFEVIVGEEGNEHAHRLYLRWFNMPYIAKLLATGQTLYIYGKAKEFNGKFGIINPDFEIIESDNGLSLADKALGGVGLAQKAGAPAAEARETIHTGRIVPIYRGLSGIPARRYREIIWGVLSHLSPEAKPSQFELTPAYPFRQAIEDIHFPKNEELSKKARMRFALAECFKQQFKVQWRRRRSQGRQGQICVSTDFYMQELLTQLPFKLTGAQLRCVDEIRADMAHPQQMNRLVQGDVGSGKTLVALCAMLLAIESGKTAALIAPTQILAEQHYNNFKKLLGQMDIRLALRTSDKREDVGYASYNLDENDDTPRIIVGTHALLYKKNRPKKLGLAVIDEQHKFGVAQREQFINSTDEAPDVLVMTATPIPRTLTLTIYGDLDVSIIDELPSNRGEIHTALRNPKHMKRIIAFMQKEMEAGRQIYIVSPLIEESEKRAQASALSELKRWKEIFPQREIGLLHGRLTADEKEAVMQSFRNNQASILVATTVVEVGVDVPNATIMLINNADTFGLSQLHQLRGRIGRGEHKSYCILLSQCKEGEEGREKLDILCRSINGFEIAEEDFRLRGPGDVLGTAQSGLGSVQFSEWLSDIRLIHRATRDAAAILDADPNLEQAQHAPLLQLIQSESEQAVMS